MTQTVALERWWNSLGIADRRAALDVEPGAALEESFAASLAVWGVRIAAVAVGIAVGDLTSRRVLHVQPRELSDFLAARRAVA